MAKRRVRINHQSTTPIAAAKRATKGQRKYCPALARRCINAMPIGSAVAPYTSTSSEICGAIQVATATLLALVLGHQPTPHLGWVGKRNGYGFVEERVLQTVQGNAGDIRGVLGRLCASGKENSRPAAAKRKIDRIWGGSRGAR